MEAAICFIFSLFVSWFLINKWNERAVLRQAAQRKTELIKTLEIFYFIQTEFKSIFNVFSIFFFFFLFPLWLIKFEVFPKCNIYYSINSKFSFFRKIFWIKASFMKELQSVVFYLLSLSLFFSFSYFSFLCWLLINKWKKNIFLYFKNNIFLNIRMTSVTSPIFLI